MTAAPPDAPARGGPDREVWYAIPSASPEKARENLPAWTQRGYRVAVLQNQEKADLPVDRNVWSDDYPGWAGSINKLVRDVVPASADLIVSGGDDMLPVPDRSAQDLASEFFDRFPDGFGVMQPCGDAYMHANHYCGSPWLGRAFCDEAYGGRGPMWPGYRHNWADVELHDVAEGLGVLWMRPEIAQHHAHFSRAEERAPAWWERNVEDHDRRDVELFLTRQALGFPGHEPAGDRPAIGADRLDPNPWAWRHWINAYGQDGRDYATATRRIREALNALAARGVKTVAVYPGGRHTVRGAAALASPAVEVIAVLDDNAAPTPAGRAWGDGDRFLGWPRVLPGELLAPPAGSAAPEAVLLSSDAHEPALWEKTRPLRDAGIEVIRLYAEGTPPPSATGDRRHRGA